MWIVYERSEVEWGVRFGEMCVIDYFIVRFTDCFVHPVVSNND